MCTIRGRLVDEPTGAEAESVHGQEVGSSEKGNQTDATRSKGYRY